MYPPTYVPGDALPGAPALAARGPHPVGITTLAFTNPLQIDVLGSLAAGEPLRATRSLTAQAWYPAAHDGRATYLDHVTLTGEEANAQPRQVRISGRAARDAEPDRSGGPWPLVVVSHRHPGSSALLSWLGENLASKGYAVLALDHTDSTHADRADPLSSLRNRPLDLALALRAAADIEDRHPLLHHVWDADRAVLVGYSLGGYGALLALGAGLGTELFEHPSLTNPLAPELLADLVLDDPFHADLVEGVTARVRAAVLLAPWGGSLVWADRALARVRTPLFIAGGSDDDVAGYAGVRRVFEGTVGADRWLLTFDHARHSVGCNPPPDALATASPEAWWHYADPVWDVRRIVSVLQHHLTAFLGTHLLGLDLEGYLAGASTSAPGESWPGYPPRSTVGLRLERLSGAPESDTVPPDDDGSHDLMAAAWTGLSHAWRAHRARSAIAAP